MSIESLREVRDQVVNVLDADANPVTNGIRWMLELDNTTLTIPGVPTNDSISLVIHDSHAPVVQTNGSASERYSVAPVVTWPASPISPPTAPMRKSASALPAVRNLGVLTDSAAASRR